MKRFPTGSGDGSANLAENLSSTPACSEEPVLALRGHTNTLFLFIHVNWSLQLLIARTLWQICWFVVRHLTQNLKIRRNISGRIQMETRACFVCSQSQKGLWQAEASSTGKKMPVSFTKCSAVKLLRSFHRMVELTNTGAKLNPTGPMSVLTEGQMSANARLNGSSLWQQYDIVCYGLSPFPSLSLRFVFLRTVMATARCSISGASQPVPALEGLWMGPSDGVQVEFPRAQLGFTENWAALHVWDTAGLLCARSLDFTAAFMGDNILLHFIHFTGARHQHHSRRLLVTHIARLDLFVIVSVLNTWTSI